MDAQALREMTSRSKFYKGSLVLPENAWEELKNQKENVYLTAEEVEEAERKGYVHKNGIWNPENKSVGKVWDALSRGKDLKYYLQHVVKPVDTRFRSNEFSWDDRKLNVYFNQTTKKAKPTMRSWIADSSDLDSNAFGVSSLDDDDGQFLIGLTLKAYEKALEARVQSALKSDCIKDLRDSLYFYETTFLLDFYLPHKLTESF